MSTLPVKVRCGPLRFLELLRCRLVVRLTNLAPPAAELGALRTYEGAVVLVSVA